MKTKVIATCQSCGAQMPKWMGRCPECAEWGSVVEEPLTSSSGPAVRPAETGRLVSEDIDHAQRLATGVPEFDRVLGGGIVAGSILLFAGEPGVGKSTLTLQTAMALGRTHDVLLVCAEEAPRQVKLRAGRIGEVPVSVHTTSDPELGAVLGAIEATSAPVVIIDSIQTIFDPDIPSAPGSVAQVRECGARLARAAREHGTAIILVGHVTKDGGVAGPRVLEHLVDVVLHFEGEVSSGMRILRALKNRFGSTQEVGFFEMRGDGLTAIRDASAYLLADRITGTSGSILAACVDGQRPFVCEIQALVTKSSLGNPRRVAVGVDAGRLPMLVAILQNRGGLQLHEHDVYVSAVGGLRLGEPAIDLPVALAIASAALDRPIPDDAVAFGELGLSGEVRQVAASERRMQEAEAVGCATAFVPHNFTGLSNAIAVRKLQHIGIALEVI